MRLLTIEVGKDDDKEQCDRLEEQADKHAEAGREEEVLELLCLLKTYAEAGQRHSEAQDERREGEAVRQETGEYA